MLIYLFSNFSLSAIHQNMEFFKSHPKKKNNKNSSDINNYNDSYNNE